MKSLTDAYVEEETSRRTKSGTPKLPTYRQQQLDMA